MFLPENKKNKQYEVNFNLGDKSCNIKTERVMGITAASFWAEDGYQNFTEKEVDKLFGR